ncbi:LysR family transcriptional regulator [Sulfitobacter sabulilitoris]|uniref:LysR family transcriptional regulator n=1 Tax=Sulfitobacter sabulilitoris TaxID=2562655 RepID=A0A5S3PG66_9RHOB|nr:LysR family transcriptional regulator [Sulfitobacter sabulilitoris]TMM53064.1 LysR family transcriptional regulator [Sulfitobacter sabulilitoris]
MIRSFTMLAQTLNLSRAVRELGSTRQTVRRHIATLEETMGVPLFVVEDRQYRLSPQGELALPEAKEILARGKVWVQGKSYHVAGMQRLAHIEPDGWCFYQQHQPLNSIWTDRSPFLREVHRAWAMSGGEIEHDCLSHVRPYLMVYRDTPSGWICVELGERSFYALWFGWTDARSSIGRPIAEFPGGTEFATMLTLPFRDIQTTRGTRLDQIATLIPRGQPDNLLPATYERLLMGGQFPDGSFALIAAVDRAREIRIEGLDSQLLDRMPSDVHLDFDPGLAKYER